MTMNHDNPSLVPPVPSPAECFHCEKTSTPQKISPPLPFVPELAPRNERSLFSSALCFLPTAYCLLSTACKAKRTKPKTPLTLSKTAFSPPEPKSRISKRTKPISHISFRIPYPLPLFFFLLIALVSHLSSPAQAADLYPNGKDFIFGMYTCSLPADMARIAKDGYNLVQSYSFRSPATPNDLTPEQYLAEAKRLGLSVMMTIGTSKTEPGIPPATPQEVRKLAAYDNLLWWYVVPEELRSSDPKEMAYLKTTCQTIRDNDPQKRPLFMYIPTNYLASDIKPYVPWLNIIGAGAYTNYALKPRPWIHWRIQSEIDAIHQARSAQPNFPIAGPRLPLAILWMAPPESKEELPTLPQDAYHDCWLSLLSGAKGILILSDAHRNQINPGVYQTYSNVAKQLNGPSRLGEVILFGKQLDTLPPTILSGPAMSDSFTDSFSGAGGKTFQYPSVTAKTYAYNKNIYLIAVNSAEAPVNVRFNGIRPGQTFDINAMFESRKLDIKDGAFTDHFEPKEVHIYKMSAKPDQFILGQQSPTPSAAPIPTPVQQPADLKTIFEDSFDKADGWEPYNGKEPPAVSNGIATFTRPEGAGTEYWIKSIGPGAPPKGAFLEMRIKCPPTSVFFLQLVQKGDKSAGAFIHWQPGTGQWEILRVPVTTPWEPQGSLWLGIRGGTQFQVDSIGIYVAK